MLKDKVTVVTGGAGFLGRVFVRCIAEHGGIAVVADIDAESAIELAEQITAEHPGRAEAAKLDVTKKESVSSLILELQKRYGHIDAVVNNAYPHNRNYGRKLEDVTFEDFCENVDLHLGGYFLVAQQFALFFREQGWGNIVNMASIYGAMTPRFEVYAGTAMTMPVEYAAIKSAVIHLTRYFAQYFKANGIRVNALSPGGIRNNQPKEFLTHYDSHCAGRGMLEAKDVSGALIFLLSDASRYITGQNLIVDDGFSL